MVSVFDLFKIGIGPSSSHTMAPMTAAKRFRDNFPPRSHHVTVELFGSLAWTGRGHATDIALCLGLLGQVPANVDPDEGPGLAANLKRTKEISLPDGRRITFDPERDLIFNTEELLPRHSNGMRFSAIAENGSVLSQRIFYSIGGGFVQEEGDLLENKKQEVPHSFANAMEMLRLCEQNHLSVARLQMANELSLRPRSEVEAGLDAICRAMFDCIDRGLRTNGELPGGMRVQRRAKALMEKLAAGRINNEYRPHEIMDWVSTYAIAVNEENASGGRIVTAPTNGAAGIVPAVLRYYRDFYADYSLEQARSFLLSAAAIGSIIKRNASISGAEVGCQGEVGTAASMAAAGLAAVLGGTPNQIENAAEIAMEHHLGMTCDPIGGLVQIPCIERNAFGANKAIAAASLALRSDGSHRVSLDQVVETMRQTGTDMHSKYKETSRGGLAINVPQC